MKKLTIKEADMLVSLLRRAIENEQFWMQKERKATADMEEVRVGDWNVGEETFSGDGTATQEFECERMTREDTLGRRLPTIALAVPKDVVRDMYKEKG